MNAAKPEVVNIFERMINTGHRLTHFDGLRGVAACMVFFSHLLCAFYPATNSGLASEVHTGNYAELILRNTPLNILFNGELAVCIFFVISGYVLSCHYFFNPDKKRIIANVVKRYPRLMILVWISVVVSFAFQKLQLYHTAETASLTRSAWLNDLFSVPQSFIAMLKNIGYEQFLAHNTPTPLNPVLWTISTELKGSFLVFFILLVIPNNRWRYAIYAAFFLYYLNGHFMLFISGLVLADLGNSELRQPKKSWLVWGVLMMVSVVFGSYKSGADFILWRWIEPIERITKPNFIGAVSLLFLVCYHPTLQNVLNKMPSQWLGKISYSLYLFHLLIICSLICPLFILLYSLSGIYHFSALASMACAIPVTFIICRYVFTPIDEWSVAISSKLGKRVENFLTADQHFANR